MPDGQTKKVKLPPGVESVESISGRLKKQSGLVAQAAPYAGDTRRAMTCVPTTSRYKGNDRANVPEHSEI